MSWSYSDSLTTARDRVRFRTGDTDTNRQMVSNETLDALLVEYNSNVLRVSVIAVRGILAQLTRDTNRSIMGVSGSIDQATTHFRDLLRDLIAEMNTEAGVSAGAITISRAETMDAQNGDSMVPPDFRSGQFDIKRTTGTVKGPDWNDV